MQIKEKVRKLKIYRYFIEKKLLPNFICSTFIRNKHKRGYTVISIFYNFSSFISCNSHCPTVLKLVRNT